MIKDFVEPSAQSYTVGVKFESLSPIMQGVTEPVTLVRLPDKEIKARVVRTVATVMSAKELGFDKPSGEAKTAEMADSEGEEGKAPEPDKTSEYRSVVIEIPVLGANALRHKMRAMLADHLLASCGLTVKDFAFASNKTVRQNYHVLYSGGGLTKGDKPIEGFWTAERIAWIYREWPILSLFGASYGGNMLQGKVSVSQGYPLVEKVIPYYFYSTEEAEKLFPRNQWIDIHPYGLIRGRNAQHLDELWAEYRHPDNRVPMEDMVDEAGNTKTKAGTREMIIQAQYVPAGVPFGVVVRIEGATELEASALRYILDRWNGLGVIGFGGKLQSGMGHLSVQVEARHLPEADIYEEYIAQQAPRIRQALMAEPPWQEGMLAVSLDGTTGLMATKASKAKKAEAGQ